MLKALRPFFEEQQLPNAKWIMSWDVRGAEPSANAVATAGRIAASFQLSPDPYRAPIRVEQLSEGVVVHMMKKGVFGKAKPAPIDLGKYVLVAFERTAHESIATLKENPNKSAQGLRFAVTDAGATWVSITAAGDADGEPNPLDSEDVAPIRQLTERANAALKDLITRRTLVDLLAGQHHPHRPRRAADRPPRAARPADAARALDPREEPDERRADPQARHRRWPARGAVRAARDPHRPVRAAAARDAIIRGNETVNRQFYGYYSISSVLDGYRFSIVVN